MTEFADLFSTLEPPRASNARRHSLHDILVIAFGAVLCGGQTCADMELFGHAKRELLQSFLKLDNGIPCHDTGSRLPGMLDPVAFQQWFIGFMRQFDAGGNDAGVLAVDGKTLCRSCDRAGQRSPLNLVSAWAEEQRLVLEQLAVDAKSNKITALPRLLEMLTLRGKVVTADAMHCQSQVAQQARAYPLSGVGQAEPPGRGLRRSQIAFHPQPQQPQLPPRTYPPPELPRHTPPRQQQQTTG